MLSRGLRAAELHQEAAELVVILGGRRARLFDGVSFPFDDADASFGSEHYHPPASDDDKNHVILVQGFPPEKVSPAAPDLVLSTFDPDKNLVPAPASSSQQSCDI